MDQIIPQIPISPNINNQINYSQEEHLENSKIIINTLLKEITNEQEKQINNNFNETIPVFLYEFFIFELYTPKEIFKTLHQPILAFRLLDFPTLSVDGRIDKEKELIIFNQGKSSFFEMELDILKDYLANEPLYVMFIDLNFGDMKIIASSRVNISIFNNDHFLKNEDKFLPKRRRNLLKLFDKNQTVIAEFDISLLIKREFFKYDSKQEILDKLNIDDSQKKNNVCNNNNYHGENFNQTNTQYAFNKTSINNNEEGKFYSQTNNINDNNFNYRNTENNNFKRENNNNYNNEKIMDDFINYNYNSNKSYNNKPNSLSQNQTQNINFNSLNSNGNNLFNEQQILNNKFLYNPNKENLQNLLNPSQGKSYVYNLKDLLDGCNKQPPPLYFNNKRKNEENYFFCNQSQIISNNQNHSYFIPQVSSNNFNIVNNENIKNIASENIENENYESQYNFQKSKLKLNSNINMPSEKIHDNHSINHHIENGDDFRENKFEKNDNSTKSEANKSIQQANQNNFLNKNQENKQKLINETNKTSYHHSNMRYNNIENTENKQVEVITYIKKPKTIPSKEFKKNSHNQKIDKKFLDKKFEKYETKQKMLGKETISNPKKSSLSEISDKTSKRIEKRNSAYDYEEENEYIKLYSKLKFDDNIKLKELLKTNKYQKDKKLKRSKDKKETLLNSKYNFLDEEIEKKSSNEYSSDDKKYKRHQSKEKYKQSKEVSKHKKSVKKNYKRKQSNEYSSDDDSSSNYSEDNNDQDNYEIKLRHKSKAKKSKKKPKYSEDSQESASTEFLNYKSSKYKNTNEKFKNTNSVKNKLKKERSKDRGNNRKPDKNLIFESPKDYPKKEKSKKYNLEISNEKDSSPKQNKKGKFNQTHKEEDSKILITSNNYINTESNLEYQMKNNDKLENKNKLMNNQHYEITNSNAFSLNSQQMSNLQEKFKDKDLLVLKSLAIKTENSLNIMSNKNSIREEITENINYISNNNISNISEEKINNKRKKSRDYSLKKSLSSSTSKNLKFNNINVNKSEITIEEESNLNIINKSDTSKKYLIPNQKSIISNNSNIPEEFQNFQGNDNKLKTTENNYDEYLHFDYDYNSSNSKIIPSQTNFIDEDIIEDINYK